MITIIVRGLTDLENEDYQKHKNNIIFKVKKLILQLSDWHTVNFWIKEIGL